MVMSQITENLSDSSVSDAPNNLETYTFIYGYAVCCMKHYSMCYYPL